MARPHGDAAPEPAEGGEVGVAHDPERKGDTASHSEKMAVEFARSFLQYGQASEWTTRRLIIFDFPFHESYYMLHD